MRFDMVELVLDPLLEDYGRDVTYLSPDSTVMLPLPGEPPLRGLILKNGVPLGPDSEDTGGIMQTRTILRLRLADFPDGYEPEQLALVTVDGERSQVTDVMVDPNGWADLPLGDADG